MLFKLKFIKLIFGSLVLFSLCIQSCAPFNTLPQTVEHSSTINGIYFNDCDSTDSWGCRKLWSHIDYKNNIEEDSLLVQLHILPNGKIKAQLLKNKLLLQEKIIKGKVKEDNCFYTRRVFFIVPILPILWGFSNTQERFYIVDNTLLYEATSNSGGAAIFMAGGDKWNHYWKYQKLNR